MCPQMIAGSQPTQVNRVAMEHINEATARPDVRGAAAVACGTTMAAWQTGQVVCFPTWAVSQMMVWPQAGHGQLNSLIKVPIH
jgi:hypothetical protein